MRMLPSREKTRRRVGHPPCSTNYRFTGYERDAETSSVTGSMYYAFARYYNSREGRFMSGDPVAGDPSDPQTLNRYSYVRNNPVNLTDPSGMFTCGPAICPPGPPGDGIYPGDTSGWANAGSIPGSQYNPDNNQAYQPVEWWLPTAGPTQPPTVTPPPPPPTPAPPQKQLKLVLTGDCLDGNGRWR